MINCLYAKARKLQVNSSLHCIRFRRSQIYSILKGTMRTKRKAQQTAIPATLNAENKQETQVLQICAFTIQNKLEGI